MNARRLVLFPVALALVLVAAPGAESQEDSILWRSGCHGVTKETIRFGDRSMSRLDFFCAMENVGEEGFLHRTSLFCPIVSEVVGDTSRLFGHCVIVDAEGDEVYLTVERKSKPGVSGAGRWQITGGSGRYQEATGSGTYYATYLPSAKDGTFQLIVEWFGKGEVR